MTTQEATEEIAGLFERMAHEPQNETVLAETIRQRLKDMRRNGIKFPVDFVVLEAELERAVVHH